MVFTDTTWEYFSLIPFKVRAAMADSRAYVPFTYEDEPFFASYDALHKTWVKRQSQRMVAEHLSISRDTLKTWEEHFTDHGTIGLLPELSSIAHHKRKKSTAHDKKNRAKSFYNFDHDPMQQKA